MNLRDLHVPGDSFVLANAWDRGTARLFEGLGAKAVATSSVAHAFTLGRTDGAVTLDEALGQAAALAGAVDVPLAIDFEDGFARVPEDFVGIVARAAATGAAGISVEDHRRDAAPYPLEEAVARVGAAAAACRAQGLHLTARADGVMHGAYDVAEAVRRLTAFAGAGADCLYAPALPDDDAIRRIVAIGPPVNVLAAGDALGSDLAHYAALGVARVSLGSTPMRLVQRTLLDAAAPLLGEGRITALRHAPPADEVDRFLG
ncbi:isocitrate lyase/phosphoenolpyruvate mutase family protein [Hasllibacter halocynthiae]|nr:isocitrate lyase/phosphoenolpyruvate mutase family protein [Hasllibacter halocynthiae]